MNPTNLLIIGSGTDEAAHALVDRALTHWNAATRPKAMWCSVESLLEDPSPLSNAGGAWFVLRQPCERLFEAIGLLQDKQIPALLTQWDEHGAVGDTFQPGVLLAPSYAPPLVHCSMLRTLWSQVEALQSISHENALLRTHHTGLCEQISRIDEELRLAAQLQREFLPEVQSQFEPLHVRVLFRPAGYVSGDIYDVIRLDEDHVGIYIADAVGHGVPAALMTVYLTRSLQTRDVSSQYPTGYRLIPPDEALTLLNNEMLKQQTHKMRFATAAYGVINLRTLQFSFSRAGHPYPMLLRADGSVEWIKPDGGLLGIFPDQQFELAKIQLEPGDRLLIYTDGFELAFPDAPKDSVDAVVNNNRYEQEFRDLANGSADEAMVRLEQKLDAQIGSLNQLDDMTILMISTQGANCRIQAQGWCEQTQADELSGEAAPAVTHCVPFTSTVD